MVRRDRPNNSLRMSSHGRQITESAVRVSKDEDQYYKSKSCFFKGEENKDYKRQIPDYFRVLDNPNNKIPLASHGVDGMVTVISKNQGWITVTPKHQNRKKPLEKSNDGDVTKTSILTPSWMNMPYPKNKTDPMQGKAEKFGLRGETNRTFLFDKQQPEKSVFSYGSFRHNVHSKEMAQAFMKQVPNQTHQTKLIGWEENTGKQKFDKHITGKIGSAHME